MALDACSFEEDATDDARKASLRLATAGGAWSLKSCDMTAWLDPKIVNFTPLNSEFTPYIRQIRRNCNLRPSLKEFLEHKGIKLDAAMGSVSILR